MTVKQMVEDYLYLENNYGAAYDFCGGFCSEDYFRKLLFGESTRRETMYDLIEYFFTKPQALKQLDLSDKRVLKIKKRYGF